MRIELAFADFFNAPAPSVLIELRNTSINGSAMPSRAYWLWFFFSLSRDQVFCCGWPSWAFPCGGFGNAIAALNPWGRLPGPELRWRIDSRKATNPSKKSPKS